MAITRLSYTPAQRAFKLATDTAIDRNDSLSIFDELSDLEGKTDVQKHEMIPNGNVIEELGGKEDKMAVEGGKWYQSLLAEIGTYYNIAGTVGTLAITLPAVADTSHLSSIVFFLTTSTTPSLSLASADSSPIYYADNYSIEASSTFEINALYNGTAWVVAAVKITTT